MSSSRDSRSAGERLRVIDEEVIRCRRCPRLVEWREKVADEKRAAFDSWDYWGRPVPGFGDPGAWLLAVGLAPAAHGANRTGRMFTGDRSGDWLFRGLHRAGFANQPEATNRNDGLRLSGIYVTASVRCAPPENKPKPSERKNCREYLEREIDALLSGLDVVVALGGYAYRHVMRVFRDRGWEVPSPMPDFGHGVEVDVAASRNENVNNNSSPVTDLSGDERGPAGYGLTLLCSYHPSQQNTFTGTLTEEMFDAVWTRARELREEGAGA